MLLTVTDVNDVPPVISSPSEGQQLGYPTNEGLQQTAGPVTRVQVRAGYSRERLMQWVQVRTGYSRQRLMQWVQVTASRG